MLVAYLQDVKYVTVYSVACNKHNNRCEISVRNIYYTITTDIYIC
jgi:hypothetical protein